ncbi:MAG TPA: nuclear transport factor 2 family protein [Chitinophagaceae bacterium]
MKKNLLLLPLLAMVFSFLGCESKKGSGESPEAMVKAADELDKKFAEAFSKGDLNGLMDTYWNSAEMVSYSPDAPNAANYEQSKAGMAQMFAGMKGAKLEIHDASNRVEGEVVLGHGNWTITLADSAGTKINGRFTDVKAKKDGKWVYIMDHASVPLPPPTK